MKKILSILFLLPLLLSAQIKIKDLPTTTTGAVGDFLLKDDVAGIPGSTKKINITNFKATYFPNIITGTGTTNYIAKWSSSTAQTSSLIYDNGTNIGIGTTSPLALLYIKGSNAMYAANYGAHFSARSIVDKGYVDSLAGTITVGSGTQNYITKWNNAGGTTIGNSILFDNGTNVGIGTNAPVRALQMNGASYFNGNVGIGTFLNTYKLVVSDSNNAANASSIFVGNPYGGTGTSGHAGVLFGSGALGHYNARIYTHWTGVSVGDERLSIGIGYDANVDAMTFAKVGSSGYVGIGTTTPTASLHIQGDLSTSSSYAFKANNSSSTALLGIRNDGAIFYAGGKYWHAGSANTNTTNLFFGNTAGNANITDLANIGLGIYTLNSLDAASAGNNAIGYNSSNLLVTGDANNSIGGHSLENLTTGNYNIALGHYALAGLGSGSENIAIGHSAGGTLYAGSSYNVFMGAYAGTKEAVQDESFGVGVGYAALSRNYGTYSAALGASSGSSWRYTVGDVNCNSSIYLGASAATSSNEFVIGGNSNVGGVTYKGIKNVRLNGRYAQVADLDSITIQPVNVTDSLYSADVAAGSAYGATVLNGDAANSKLIFAGSQSTGNKDGGNIVFKVAPAGVSGRRNNPLTTVLQIKGDGILQYTGSTPTNGYVLTSDASGNATWQVNPGAGGSGVTTMAAIGATPNANGATISSTTLNLEPASASFGGVVTTGTQTFAGNKTFSGTTTLATPFTLGATSVTSTGTQLNYLNAATGTTGTTSTNLVFSTSPSITTPTFVTSATVPLIIGGSSTTQSLIYKTTTGVGAAGADHIFQVGNNGATEAMIILNSGNVGVGSATPSYQLDVLGTGNFPFRSRGTLGGGMIIGAWNATYGGLWSANVSPSTSNFMFIADGNVTDFGAGNSGSNIAYQWFMNNSVKAIMLGNGSLYLGGSVAPTGVLHLAAGTATASSAPLKLTTGTSLTTAEAGAFEYTTPQLFFTNGGAQRQEIPQIQQSRVTTQFDKTTNTTLASITGLTATLVAGKTYRFEANLYIDADVVGGSKYDMSGTATATSIIYELVMVDNTTNANTITSRGTALASSVGQAGTTAGFVKITGLITVNGAGTLTPRFSQNASSGTSSVLVGSTFETKEIN